MCNERARCKKFITSTDAACICSISMHQFSNRSRYINNLVDFFVCYPQFSHNLDFVHRSYQVYYFLPQINWHLILILSYIYRPCHNRRILLKLNCSFLLASNREYLTKQQQENYLDLYEMNEIFNARIIAQAQTRLKVPSQDRAS